MISSGDIESKSGVLSAGGITHPSQAKPTQNSAFKISLCVGVDIDVGVLHQFAIKYQHDLAFVF